MSWNPGQLVRHIDDPAKMGTVTDQTRPRASGLQYRVSWNGRLDWHYAGELVAADVGGDDPYELIRAGRYGRVDDLRRLLTHVHLAGRLANVIYAMGLTQTDFYPHQYKPLLTLLDSPVNGLLIADEVGLGKTIEAGLIWTELRARYDLRRLLVVCPAMLREKWRTELVNRFGVDAHVVDVATLLREIETPDHRERAWIVSYQGIRTPSHWNTDKVGAPGSAVRSQLADLLRHHADENPLFDLVIFDEAHYMRNEETGAWRTGSLLRDVSTYQVMLSATPINLKSEDLFNLLRLLDPDHFEYREHFQYLVQANYPVIAASNVVRDLSNNGDRIREAIRGIAGRRWFGDSSRADWLIEEVEAIQEWTHEKRVDIAAKLERLNLLAHIVTRTRKREVPGERPVRDPTVFEADMTLMERALYQAITEGTREYAQINDIKHGFLLSMPQRMVASSPAALLRTWRDDWVDTDALATTMDETDEDEARLDAASSSLKHWLASQVLREFDLDELVRQDSKFAQFSQALRRLLAEDGAAKALVFTTFRGTARYLVERLSGENVQAGLLMGGVEFNKEAVISAFRNDCNCRVLVCTDVAAEGVDLQFCRLVVNYDLPWNPMRIEQRIGRIDRIGQQSRRILVWNFVHKDTIDARIMSRLVERVGVFESTLGEAEEILGQVRKLEDTLLSRHLTAAEETRLIDETALAIEHSRRKQETLEHEAIQLIAHGQQLLEQIEAARGGGKLITRHDLLRYVNGWLGNVQGCRCNAVLGQEDTFDIQLAPAIAAEFDEFLRREGLVGKTTLASGQNRRCRFTERITDKPGAREEIIHRFHPLLRFVSHKLEKGQEHFPLYASKVTVDGIAQGHWVLLAKLASFSGIKDEEHLLVTAVPLDGGPPLDDRSADHLFDAVRKSGANWANIEIDGDTALLALDRCEELLGAHYGVLKDNKKRENRDRANLLTQLLDNHICKKRAGFEQRIQAHEIADLSSANKRRKGLASAERHKLAAFLARMETRQAALERKSAAFAAEIRDICTLMVKVI